ncbi:hypothetical protein FA95DRAFT_923232 [Auriscalpium vulgare]|uniref:Uncharacterized protein n=1 Tax=Auriscalpium vulgare TaxID=40419 RepID=A0ACB8RZD5_9AGAM|nr:hypothetical protein FA95DRAFT_923232 [Auriscalpium vulgare]
MPLKMGIDDFCFLSPSEYMIVIPRGYLDVYSFEDPATHRNVYPTLLRRFGLPRLRPGYYYWYISATANPIPGAPHSEGTAPSSAPSAEQAPTSTEHPDVMPFTSYTPAPTPFSLPAFHARPDDGLIACSLGTLNPSTHAPVDCFVFFIRASMLLELARSNKAEASEESTYDALMAAASAGLPPMTHHHPHTAFPSFAIPATDNDQPPQPVNSLASMFVEPLDIHATSAFAEDIHDLSTFVSSPTTTSTNLPPSHQSLAAPSLLAPLPSSSVPSSPPYPSGILNPDPSPLTPAPTSPALQFSNLTAPALPAPLPPPPVAVPPFALFPPVPSAMLHPHVPPAAHVAWEDWGPRATRWFGDMLSSDWQHAVHGFRTVERVAQDPQATRHRIRVRDYNPLLVARERARDKGKGRVRAEAAEVEAQDKAKAAAGDENEKAREPAEGSGPSVRLVTEASTIRAGVAFVRDVVSWLPYREVVTEQAIEVSDVMLDDNRILCLKVRSITVWCCCRVEADALVQRGPEGQLSSMDVLTF